MDIDDLDNGREIDMSELLERDNVEYERKNRKNIRISVLSEPKQTDEEKEQSKRDFEAWAQKGRESIAKIERDIKEGKSNFGKVILSEGFQQVMK